MHDYEFQVINLENFSCIIKMSMSNFNTLSSETITSPVSHNVLLVTGSGSSLIPGGVSKTHRSS